MILRYNMKKNVWLVKIIINIIINKYIKIKCNIFFLFLYNYSFILKILKEVDQEMILLKEKIDKLLEENNVSKAEKEKYKQTINLLEKELSLVQKDKIQIQETLKSTDDIKVSLETKINNYQQQINETEQQLSLVKNDYNQYTEVCYFSLYYKNILYKFKHFIDMLYFTEIEYITSRF